MAAGSLLRGTRLRSSETKLRHETGICRTTAAARRKLEQRRQVETCDHPLVNAFAREVKKIAVDIARDTARSSVSEACIAKAVWRSFRSTRPHVIFYRSARIIEEESSDEEPNRDQPEVQLDENQLNEADMDVGEVCHSDDEPQDTELAHKQDYSSQGSAKDSQNTNEYMTMNSIREDNDDQDKGVSMA